MKSRNNINSLYYIQNCAVNIYNKLISRTQSVLLHLFSIFREGELEKVLVDVADGIQRG